MTTRDVDTSTGGANCDLADWEIARRWRQYEAEQRINVLRIFAIGVFYLIHLVHHLSASRSNPFLDFLQFDGGDVLSESMHVAVTAVAAAWTMGALLVQSLLRDQIFPRWFPAASSCLDVVLLTAMLVMTSGAASPLVAGYFLIIMMAGLRFDLRLIRLVTSSALAGYLLVLGCTRWPRGLILENKLPAIPRYQQVMMLAALILAGVIVGQWVRHSRNMADDLGNRQSLPGPQGQGEESP